MPKRKTHDEFMEDFGRKKKIYPKLDNIEILGTYVNSFTKILVKCMLDGYEWEVVPSSLLKGYGCPKCVGQIPISHAKFVDDLYRVNKNINVLGKYKNAKTRILVKCVKDEYEWQALPYNLLMGVGCPKCGGQLPKSHYKFLEDLDNINKNIEVLGEYVNNKTKILVECKLDNHRWESTPSNLLHGYGCPKCGGRVSKSHSKFLEDLAKINNNIDVLEEYVNSRLEILVRCKVDNYMWKVKPNNLLQGTGCPKCAINSMVKSHSQFVKDLDKVNSDIEVLGKYINNKTKILVKCKLDGYEWKATPTDLLNRYGCPKCSKAKKTKLQSKFIEDLRKVNQDIEVLGEYVNSYTKILVKCKLDGYEWESKPNNLLNGRGCYKCFLDRKTTSYDNFIHNFNYLYPEYASKYIVDESTYTKLSGPITITHLPCGTTYELSRASYLYNGYGTCPECYPTLSQGAKHVKDYLSIKLCEFEMEKTFEDLKDQNLLRYDFFITLEDGRQIALEYHGIQHYDDCNTLHENYDAWYIQHCHDIEKKYYAIKHNFYYLEVPCYIPFNKIPEFLEFYLEKAKTTKILNLVPNPIIDLLNRHTSKELPVLTYGNWCLFDGDIKLLNSNNLTDESEILLANRYGEISKMTVKEYLRLKKK